MTVQRRDHELSRIYNEGAWPEPRKQIDDAILEASRRAARARHPVLHRWGPPMAVAATVIVGISLALIVTDNESMRETSGLLRSEEPAAPTAPLQKKRGDAAKAETAPGTPQLHELFSSPMGPNAAKPEAKPAAPAAKAAPPSAPARQPPASAAKAPQPLTGRVAAPAADPQRVQRELDQLQENRDARAAAAAPRAAEAPAATPQSASVGDVRGLAATGARAPEAWLDDIRKLRSEGRGADAERELAEFRRRYPDYRVPEDLR